MEINYTKWINNLIVAVTLLISQTETLAKKTWNESVTTNWGTAVNLTSGGMPASTNN